MIRIDFLINNIIENVTMASISLNTKKSKKDQIKKSPNLDK